MTTLRSRMALAVAPLLMALAAVGCGDEPALIAIQIDPPTGELHAGGAATLPLTATGVYDDATRRTITASVTWSSSAAAIASVDSMGVVRAGTTAGTARITAESGSVRSQPAVVVILPSSDIVSLEVAPATASIPAGTHAYFTATASFEDGRTADVTLDATWSSSDPAIAMVGSRGDATGVAPGMATIRAVLSGVTGAATLIVSDASLVAIDIEPPSATVPVGAHQTFTGMGRYSDGTALDITSLLMWSSSSVGIATVDATGRATGVAAGTTTITGWLGTISGTAALTVSTATLERVEIEPATPPALAVGRTLAFHATGVYTDGSTIDLTADANLIWASDTPSVASISIATATAGIATGRSVGTTRIGAVYSDGTRTITATPVTLAVTDALLEQIEVTPTDPMLPVGFDLAFRATGRYSDGHADDITALVTWSTSTPATASISNASGREGMASALAAGTTTISATRDSVVGSTVLTVSAAALVSISVSPPTVDVAVGGSQPFIAIGRFDNGSTMDLTSRATWSIAPADLGRGVTVSNAVGRQGLASVAGTAVPSSRPVVLYATLGPVSGIAQLTIIGARTLTGIVVEVDEPLIPVGLTAQATASGIYSDGVHPAEAIDITQFVTWSPVVGGIVTVSNAAGSKGRVSGVARGRDRINACLGLVCANDPGGIGSTADVEVTDCAFTSLAIFPNGTADREVPRGTSRDFDVLGIFGDCVGTSERRLSLGYNLTERATWNSSNRGVFTVSNAVGSRGRVTAAAVPTSPGADLTAMYGGLSATLALTVTDACVDALTITPPSVTLPNGVRFQLTATARLTDGRNIAYTGSASWSDEEAGYVGFVGAGLVQTFTAGGAEEITATALASSGCPARSATATVTVNNATLTSIDVRPSPTDVPVGASIQLTAMGTYSDGTVFELTDLASWTSSNNDVATVDEGEVWGESAGSVVILATRGLVSGTATVSVGGRAVDRIEVVPSKSYECGTFDGAYGVGVVAPFLAIAYYTDGSEPEDVTASATWMSTAPTIVSVTGGVAQMVAPGTSNLTAAFGGRMGMRRVDVIAATLRAIDVTPNPFQLPTEATRQFRAFGHYAATGFPAAERCEITSIATWTALPVLSISIDPTGLATTTATPSVSATVTATRGAVVGIATGEVSGACVESIKVRPLSARTPLGVTQQFFADAVLSDGSSFDISRDRATDWRTANAAVAMIDEGGLLFPRSPGSTTVSAVYSPGAASCAASGAPLLATAVLEVTPALLERIEVICPVDFWPGSGEGIPAGVQTQCRAYGFYTGTPTLVAGHDPFDVTASAVWTSSSPAVASVSDAVGTKGRVFGRSVGLTTITATMGGISNGFALRVVGATLASIDVDPRSENLPVGFTRQFNARGRYALAGTSHPYEITELASWVSSAPTNATVSDAPGTRGLAVTRAVTTTPAAIRATYQTVTGSALLTVNDATLRIIEVSAPEDELALGLSQQYVAVGIYRNGGVATFSRDITSAVSWATTNSAVADIAHGGLVTASGLGSAAITAELDAASGSAQLDVVDKCINELELIPSTASLPANVPLTFQVIAHYSAGPPAAITASVDLHSSDPARMPAPDSHGWTATARGAAPGMVTITASSDSGMCPGMGEGTAIVTITDATLTAITVTAPDGPIVPVGLKRQLRANGYYSDGSSYDITRSVDSWTTGSPAVGTISNVPPTQGLFTALTVGTTPVVGTQGTISGMGSVSVDVATLTGVEVQGLRTLDGCFSPTETSSWTASPFGHPAGGYETRARAIGTFSDGAMLDLTAAVTWSSTVVARATVLNAPGHFGQVFTGAAGAVDLIATADNGMTDNITMNVVSGVLDRLELQRGGVDPIMLALGNGASLTLQGRFGGAYYCVTENGSYVSSIPGIAWVSNAEGTRGRVQSIGVGSAFVTATIGLVNDTIPITVGSATLSYLAIVPSTVSMRVGATAQLRVEAHYSDGMVNDVSYNAGTSWTSSNLGVAEVGAGVKGLVRGISVGTATIDACLTGVCASVGSRASSVTVTP